MGFITGVAITIIAILAVIIYIGVKASRSNNKK